MSETGPLPSQVTDEWWLTVHAEHGEERPVRADPAHHGESTVGKWLVFVPVRYIDQYWHVTRQAVRDGTLGPAAKVATARPHPRQSDPTRRVIVVYTVDWTDEDDVRRVLQALRALGVTWRITYKTDEDTDRGIYGRHAAVYISPSDSADFTKRIQRPQPRTSPRPEIEKTSP